MAVFPSSLAAQAAGYERRLIDAVIRGRQKEHRGLGWRRADASSHLGEFIRLKCIIRPDAERPSCIEVDEFLGEFLTWRGLPLDPAYRALIVPRLVRRLGIGMSSSPNPKGPGLPPIYAQVVEGLVWAA